jgi:phenylacetate-CoA ligase
MGRSDDMIIFRGVNIYPGQISDVIQHYPELGGEYHIELTRKEGKDSMRLKLERHSSASSDGDGALARAFTDGLRKVLLVTAEVEITPPGALPRAFGKSKRVTDLRLE